MRRDDMWSRLSGEVDLMVIGGGINGAGIARDAARRGLSVAMLEMADLATGTSSRSSKLVHGGLRYLEQYEFSLVFEAVSERRILMDIAPHLVNPMGFLFPIYSSARRKLWVVNAGMWVYDGLSLFRSPKLHRNLDVKAVAKEEPALKRNGLKGAPLYYDCATDDARLTLETALDAAQAGATIATYAKVVSFLKEESGRVVGAIVEDQLGGELREVRARCVVNATGPWTDRTLTMSQPPEGGKLLRPTKGVHIVVPHRCLPVVNAIVAFHPTDGRVLFAIPWGDSTYIGTTDTDYEGDPADVAATAEDVAYLIDAALAYFPDHPIRPEDVFSTWAGLRPLIRPPEGPNGEVDESGVSREHRIVVGPDGIVTIAGGKLTTYRRMSAEVVDTAVNMLRLTGHPPPALQAAHTDQEPLPGAVGWPEDDDHERVARQVKDAAGQALAMDSARLLTDTYGMLAMEIAHKIAADPTLAAPIVAGRPEVVAQVDWAVERELACEVSDLFIRRTQLYYKDADQGLSATDEVTDRMARLLGWSEERAAQSAAAYRAEVARSREWRTPA
jgi:glycerol-3-phosphate dehydrogenase